MLVRFAFSNFLSFRDETILDLTPTRGKKFPRHVLKHGKTMALRFAAIFGPNASGKTNFVRALSCVRDSVVGTQHSISKLVYDKFLLDDDCKALPISFITEFIYKDCHYRYSLSLSDGKFVGEALDILSGKKTTQVFTRNTVNGVTVASAWGDKDQLTGAASLLNQIRDTETVLGFANGRGSVHVDGAFEWFSKKLIITTGEQENIYKLAKKHGNLMAFLSKKISEIDLGIRGVTIKSTDFAFPSSDDMQSELKDIFPTGSFTDVLRSVFPLVNEIEDISTTEQGMAQIHTLEFERVNRGVSKSFPKRVESDGTKRILHLLPLCYLAAQADCTIVMDKLERSLHSQLAAWFLRLFSAECNKSASRSQLIFTSHETSILHPQTIRDDEIWFVEKDETGSGRLFPLTEFDVPDKLNRRKAYLEGRFGAVPYLTCDFEEE